MDVQHEGVTWRKDDRGYIWWWSGVQWIMWNPDTGGPQPPPAFLGRSDPKRQNVIGFIVGIAMLAGLFALCSLAGDPGSPSEDSPGAVSDEEDITSDPAAESACRHFRNILGDVQAGILTDAELREKFTEVHGTAIASDDADLRQAATLVLNELTSGRVPAYLKAVGRLDSICDRHL